jgi:hypothetical protein
MQPIDRITKELYTDDDKWSINTVMYIINRLSSISPMVRVVDPMTTTLILDNKWTSIESDLILFPLFHQNAWSLLIYSSYHRQWIHCHSTENRHRDHVIQLLSHLHQLKIINIDNTRCCFLSHLSERASHVIFYVFITLNNMNQMRQIGTEKFIQKLSNEMTTLCETNRMSFLFNLYQFITNKKTMVYNS